MTLEPNPLGKHYNIRYRLCDEHLRAEGVLVQGHPQRFCQARGPVECMREARGKFYKLTALNAFRVRFPSLQKCSRFHALELFESGKRTCIKMLELQNSRRRAPDAKPKAEHLATSAQATSWALPEGMGPEAGCLRVLLHPHRAQEAPPHLCSTPAAAAAAAPDLLFAAAQRTPRPGEVQSLLASQLARSSTGGESASALHPSQVLLQHLHHRLAPAPQPLLLPADAPSAAYERRRRPRPLPLRSRWCSPRSPLCRRSSMRSLARTRRLTLWPLRLCACPRRTGASTGLRRRWRATC